MNVLSMIALETTVTLLESWWFQSWSAGPLDLRRFPRFRLISDIITIFNLQGVWVKTDRKFSVYLYRLLSGHRHVVIDSQNPDPVGQRFVMRILTCEMTNSVSLLVTVQNSSRICLKATYLSKILISCHNTLLILKYL